MPLSSGQRLAVEQLRDLERASDGAVELRREPSEPKEGEHFEIELSVLCHGLEMTPDGLPLRDREPFVAVIPTDFPFVPPSLWTRHRRFSGFEHVQWGRHLCLYQAPEMEWDPSDGMFGFIARLIHWLELGARDQFEPAGEPLHPPAVYTDVAKAGMVIPRANTPTVTGQPWFGIAHLDRVHDKRVDIVSWTDLADDLNPADPTPAVGATRQFGAVVLLEKALPFEYPAKVSDLLSQLAERGISQRLFLLTLVIAALRNEKGAPLYAVVGAPMRGLSGGDRKQHLAAWRLEPWTADALRIMSAQFSEHGELREIGDKAEAILLEWANTAPVAWAWVREARSEVTIRRDRGSPAEVFAGRTVAVWGCGALGAHVAEFLARAGVKKLVLRDQSDVAPGILVRQPFEDQDVGLSKALSVAERVRRIDARIEAVGLNGNLLTHPLGEDDWADGADVVIDASASIPVLEKLELQRIRSARDPVPMISMTIDHKAERGLLVVSSGSHTGGPFDVTRRAKLEACQRAELREFADAFWPGSDTQRQPIFQPEPGCSASTFIGSATDLSALAASMLNLAAADLTKAFASVSDPHTANAHLITLPHVSIGTGMVRQASFAISSDVVSFDAQTDYEIRIARGAWHEMQGWIERGRRTLGATVETGGVLFGERNDACRILWVSELIGPPPDSSSAVEGFVCGVAGVAAANNEKGKRTRGSAVFVGMWHTHPNDAPLPSLTDLRGMATIVRGAGTNPAKALLAIVGRTTRPMPALGTFLFTRDEFSGFDLLDSDDSAFSEEHSNGSDISPEATRPVYARICDIRRAPRPLPPRKVGLALSGGGSRAIAFHLGCLRALHDRGILSQVSVLSTVSGGSIVGAMYAYSSNDFANFDDRVVRLLRSGLFGSLARRMLVPRDLFGSLGTVITAGLAAAAADFLRTGVRAGMAVFGGRDRARPSWADRIQPPFPRWRSRSTTLEAMLRDRLFGDTSVRNVTRSRLDVVINATELCTGTAFRFGNRGSGSSRFGALAEPDTSVALAVASSAAYPALLPAIDRRLRFRGNDGVSERRVLLADGGLYDNLGTLCMEPGRTESVSQHVYDPEYIIACDAGIGVVSGDSLPYWWGPRMRASFETLFRRVQNSTRNRLHEHAAMGKISGFVLPYLGQQDDRLPWTPPDLVRRETVVSYPTDFSPMSDKYITLLSRRGEQLTRLLLAHYCTEL